MFLPVKKGLFFCAHFSSVDEYQVVSVFAKFFLAADMQGGKF